MIVDIEKVKEIVLSAKPLFMNRDESANITVKGAADYVTKVDVNVQNYIMNALKKEYPSIQFMGEEKNNSDIDFSGRVWILDPVDGTTNLIHDFHGSSISLGLADNNELVMGIVYIPTSDELFYAQKGKGAYLNGERIHCSMEKELSKAVVGAGSSPYYKYYADLVFDSYKKMFMDISDIRRIGSAAIELAYVACGRLDAYTEAELKPWDYAAGKIIVEEAGGKAVDYDGNEMDISKPSSMCSSNGIIGDMLVGKYLPSIKSLNEAKLGYK